MARKFNYASLVRQCEQALKAVFTPGVSRHTGKADGTAGDHIYSIGTMRTYLSSNIRFARWVRETYGERFLGKVTPEMVNAFVKDLHARDLSHATINAYVAGIAKLDAGLRAIGWRDKNALPLVDKELYGRHGDARPQPYSQEEAQRIVKFIQVTCPDGRLALAAEAAWRGGMRIREVARLRVSEIAPSGAWLNLDGHSTKGGRSRMVPLDGNAREFFLALRRIGERHPDWHVFRDRNGLPRELQRWINRACRELGIGHSRTHDFRSAYANQLYERLIAAGASDRQARREVANALGHGRTDVLRHYLMPK